MHNCMSSAKYSEMKISFNDLSDVGSEDGCSDDDHTPSNQQLVVLPPAVAAETGRSCSRFMLPDDGWIVKAVPRPHDGQIDKYYCESRTGRKFRSRKEVERYLKGEVVHSKRSRCSKLIMPKLIIGGAKRSRYSKYIMRGGKAIKLDEDEGNEKQLSIVKSNGTAGMSISDLPDGWIIEKVRRRLKGSDKYYLEPETGLKFRSLVEVERHLEVEEDVPLSNYIEEIKESLVEVERYLEEDVPLANYFEEIKENVHLSMAFNMYHKNKDVSRKIILTGSCDAGNDPTSSSFPRPCNKEVKWLLGSSCGDDVWYPFSVEIPVPGYVKWVPVPGCVKQQWNRRFMAVMNGDN